nr:MAG TPA: hypothetical protein [Caudoviricetes sp.]
MERLLTYKDRKLQQIPSRQDIQTVKVSEVGLLKINSRKKEE